MLLSQPCELWHLDFSEQPIELQGSSAAAVELLNEPLSVQQYIAVENPRTSGGISADSRQRSIEEACPAASSSGQGRAESQPVPAFANCIVHWFKADCGAGGWLSTGPGNTLYGHWVQNVELLPEPFPVHVIKDSNGGMMAALQLHYLVDHIEIEALAVQGAGDDDSQGGSDVSLD